MKAQRVRIEASELEAITGEYRILPAQPPLRIGQDSVAPFVNPVSAIYTSDDPYPEQPVELVAQIDLTGQPMAVVQICPLKYIPSQKKLYLYTTLTLVIEGTDGYTCGDYLPQSISEQGRLIYEQMVKDMVVNKDAVTLSSNSQGTVRSPYLTGGPFEHVIITSDSYASLYQPLVDWHIKKGVRDTVVTTSYIYATYSGSDNQEKIRNFVIDARNTWNTLYLLIGGEHGTVPFEYRTYNGDNIPSDEYYGDYDGDWVYEVFVGRVTAEGSVQINRFISKVLKYETDPPLDNYSTNVCLLGMDLTLESEPPWYTLTASEDLKKSIDNSYIPAQFDVTTVYDSQMENHRTKFINALNVGQNLVNHSDHSNTFSMGTGDRNHGWYIYSSDVDGLTNTNRLSNIFSLGCHPLEMDYNDCIGEHFVIFNDLEGGVSFTGNTRSGWFYVGIPNSLSGFLDFYWWRGLFQYNQYRLGEALAWTKNNCPYTGDWTYCQWTLNLLGEPEMPIWTDSIKTLVVTHPDSFPVLPSSFPVHVEDEEGAPFDSAYVCLWKGNEIYERGYTDSGGDLTLEVAASTHGDMYVT
ncbi:MAG: C25 family cysteine peptidase, partial [Candidatus Zixiibacteriota bacterium]